MTVVSSPSPLVPKQMKHSFLGSFSRRSLSARVHCFLPLKFMGVGIFCSSLKYVYISG